MQVLTNTTKQWVKTPIVLWTLIATLFMMTGAYVALQQVNTAKAGALTSVKDTISTSAPEATAEHVFEFTIETDLPADGGSGADDFEIWVTFVDQDEFSINALTTGDINLSCTTCGGGETFSTETVTLVDTGGAANEEQIQIAFDETTGSGGITAPETFTLQIEDTPGIDNPTKSAGAGQADTYQVDLATRTTGGTDIDTGTAMVAIIEGVTVEASIDETLSFSIAGETEGNCETPTGAFTDENYAGGTVDEDEIRFGDLTSPNTFYHACQLLSVSTNATGGYDLTAEEDTSLKSAAGDLLSDGACDGACDESTEDDWTDASFNGFAYSCNSENNTPCSISAAGQYKTFACVGGGTDCDPGGGGETPQNVMEANSAADNDQAMINYRLSFSGTQEAGTYSNTITYILTPTF